MNGTIDCMADTDIAEDAGDAKKRHRLIIDTDDDLLARAAGRRAWKLSLERNRKVSKSEAVQEALLEAFKAEIQELQKDARKGKKRNGHD